MNIINIINMLLISIDLAANRQNNNMHGKKGRPNTAWSAGGGGHHVPILWHICTYIHTRVPKLSAERKNFFFPKITARLGFEIKSSFFSPFIVNGYILSCKCQKCKKNNIIT